MDVVLLVRQRLVPAHLQDAGKSDEIGGVFVQAAQPQAAQFGRRAGLEQVGASVESVHRLPAYGIARILGGELLVGGMQAVADGVE